jgi:ABC-type nitrate/sulfonate/bicarbonate transport system permease component
MTAPTLTNRPLQHPAWQHQISYYGVRLFLPLAILLGWHLVSLSWPNSPKYATPVKVANSLVKLWTRGELQLGSFVSIKHILVAFIAAGLLGAILGLAMGYLPRVNRWVAPLLHSLRPIAPYAWIPMAILWFGTGDTTSYVIVGYSAFFPMLVNAITGARNIDRRMVDAARALGAKPLTIFARVLFPAALPSLLVGARLSIGAAWIAVVAAELACGTRTTTANYTSAAGGLGQMMYIFYAYSTNLSDIIACIIAVGILSLLSDRLIHILYRWLTPWTLH